MTKEVLKLALEALEEAHHVIEYKQDATKRGQAITAIKEALAQPEPFAPDWVNYRQGKIDGAREGSEWVGLTAEELIEVYNRTEWDTNGWEYERAIEAMLKEKNT
jgi:hypothetical protein